MHWQTLTNAPQKFQGSCVLETGLSDFHLMTVAVMTKIFKKVKPRTINYRFYKHYSNEAYRESQLINSQKRFSLIMMTAYKSFVININILKRHAPRQRKHTRGNQMLFITKDLSRAIIKRPKLCNNFLKHRTGENKTLYIKQRNYCASHFWKNLKRNILQAKMKKISLITSFFERE